MISNKIYKLLHKNVVIEKKDLISKSKFIKNYSRNQIKAQLLTPSFEFIPPCFTFEINKNVKPKQIGSMNCKNSSNSNEEKNQINDPSFFTRLSYSQSGKAIVQISLINHEIPVNLSLWPRQKNFRYKQNILAQQQIENKQRLNIEVLIVGLLSTKASESFIITNKNQKNILLYKTKKNLSFETNKMNDKNIDWSEKQAKLLLVAKHQSQIEDSNLSSAFVDSLGTNQVAKASSKASQKRKRLNTKKKAVYLKKNVLHTNSSSEKEQDLILNSNCWNKIFGLEVEELSRVTLVTSFIVNTCNFYTKQILGRKLNKYVSNINSLEIGEKEKLVFLEELNFGIESRFPFRSNSNISEQKPFSNAPRAYWQDKISKELGFNNANFADWYRIYIADPEEKSNNIEWVAPDEYYHNHPIKTLNLKRVLRPKKEQLYLSTVSLFKQNSACDEQSFSSTDLNEVQQVRSWEPTRNSNLKSNQQNTILFSNGSKWQKKWNKYNNNIAMFNQPVCWNNLDQLDQDFVYHTILIRCFNDAFCIIEENRELFDLMADALLRFELLRQPKLLKITDFGLV